MVDRNDAEPPCVRHFRRRIGVVRAHVSSPGKVVIEPHPFDDENQERARGPLFPRAAVFLDALWQDQGLPYSLRHNEMPSGLRPLNPKFWLDLDTRSGRLPTELGLKREILDSSHGSKLATDKEIQDTHTGRLSYVSSRQLSF